MTLPKFCVSGAALLLVLGCSGTDDVSPGISAGGQDTASSGGAEGAGGTGTLQTTEATAAGGLAVGSSASGGAAAGGAAMGGIPAAGGKAAGGQASTGGRAPTGGRAATGGRAQGGGFAPSGGKVSTGGMPAVTGGVAAFAGGGPTTGGAPPTGGRPPSGGRAPTGGTEATGGSLSSTSVTGGASATGGSGGSSTSPTINCGGTAGSAACPEGDPAMCGMLEEHNKVRAAAPGADPAIPPLLWDCTLAATAQAWADTCPSGHSGASGLGENIYWSGSTKLSTPAQVVGLWADELSLYDYSTNYCNGAPFTKDNFADCGHYTQIVWRSTTRVGCGYANNCGSGRTQPWVCNYAPPGNVYVSKTGAMNLPY